LLREINLEPSQAPSTQPLSSQVQTQSDLIECLVPNCFIKCKKERMRQHIGQHLINNQIDDDSKTCGFCGKIGCSIALEVTSGRKNFFIMYMQHVHNKKIFCKRSTRKMLKS